MQKILILDFGGQYNQLIARRVRECRVYCEVKPYTMTMAEIRAFAPMGIIFTGGPNSVYLEESPQVDPEIFSLGVPVLGICYGCQLMAHHLGGQVTAAQVDTAREYGKTDTFYDTTCPLFQGLPQEGVSWMSHGDYMAQVPIGFRLVGHTAACPNVAIADETRGFYGVQFHPEVNHTQHGTDMIRNFLYRVCGAAGDWTMEDYKNRAIVQIREKVGGGKVLLALSGGVDSSVAAALLAEAVGNQLTCVFVDHGLMRKDEGDEVEAAFSRWDIHFVRVDAEARFLGRLAGVSDPETKRKIIGKEFIEVFNDEAKKLEGIDLLAQGTIYPDILESHGVKAHHNVGGLPEGMTFELVEPVKLLFKDEVRVVGEALGLPHSMVYRQPFPGPGLGVRCLGAITRDRLEALREADAILREEFDKNGLAGKVWQYFIAVPDMKSVGVKDGKRYEGWPAIIRAVNTTDAMTATIEEIPYPLLHHITARITHEVDGINRVVLDLTPKPTGTIEWE